MTRPNFDRRSSRESDLWATVRRGMPDVHWSRVENTAISGMSDVNGCWRGVEVWIELKIMKGWQIKVRVSQIAWTSRRIGVGGKVFFLVKRGEELRVYHPSLVMMTGRPVDREKAVMISLKNVTPTLTLAPSIDWELLHELLFFPRPF